MNRMYLCVVASAALAVSSLPTLAGDLNPPGGPVLPTMKTLQEVEPRFPIGPDTTPGDANSIFKITEPGSYYLTGDVIGQAGKHGIEIASGRVTIDLNGFSMRGGGNSLDGISTDGTQHFSISIKDGHIFGWGGDGVAGGGGLIQDGLVENVIAFLNSGVGIGLGDAAVVTGCSLSNNGGDGINILNGGVVTDCSSRANSRSGIVALRAAVISACHTGSNQERGIDVTEGSIVRGCTARFNGIDGIRCGSDNFITMNQCDQNGFRSGVTNGAGILATSAGNRIDQNLLTDNDIGIFISGAIGNLIVRNSASGNTTSNWSVPAGNSFGTVVLSPVGAGAWDNFSF